MQHVQCGIPTGHFFQIENQIFFPQLEQKYKSPKQSLMFVDSCIKM